MTNGGLETELNKAKSLNKKLKIDLVEEKHIVLSHTPFGDPAFLKKYENKVILVAAAEFFGTMTELAENYKFEKYITLKEFAAIYPEISYFVKYEYNDEDLAEAKHQVMSRFEV